MRLAAYRYAPNLSRSLLLILFAVRGRGFSFHNEQTPLNADGKHPPAVAGVEAQPPSQQQQVSVVRYSDQHVQQRTLAQQQAGEGIQAARRGQRPQLAVVVPSSGSIGGGEPQSSSSGGGPELSLNGGITMQVGGSCLSASLVPLCLQVVLHLSRAQYLEALVSKHNLCTWHIH